MFSVQKVARRAFCLSTRTRAANDSGKSTELDFLQLILNGISKSSTSSSVKAGGAFKNQKYSKKNVSSDPGKRHQPVKKPFKVNRHGNWRAQNDKPATVSNKNRKNKYARDSGVVDVMDSSNGLRTRVNNRGGSRPNNFNKQRRTGEGNKKKSGDKKMYIPASATAVETKVTLDYSPSQLSPASLLKYSSFTPVNKNLRILNATVGLIHSKNSNLSYLNNDTLLANIGQVLNYQALFGNKNSDFVPNPQIKLDSNASATVTDFSSRNLKINPPLKQLKLFSNLLKENSVNEDDLQMFNSIVKGNVNVIDAQPAVLGNTTSEKSQRNLSIVRNVLNNNSSLDYASKIKAFEPCAGLKSVKELVNN